MKILVTGGIGYIGSHTCVELLDAGYDVIVIDNLSNSKIDVLDRIKEITKKEVKFYKGDCCDKEILAKIFSENKIDAVIHFAGFKAVGESVEKPLMYYRNNLDSTLSLLEVMNEYNCKKIVFSSSATVYGNPKKLPITEDFPLHTTNPYGTTKLMIEMILNDLYISDNEWSIAILRYFNPIGAHKSGLIGEDPNGIPNNLMPIIMRVSDGRIPELSIYGDDYPTKDGTCRRDYIHVVDLAKGHTVCLEHLKKGVNIYNLGSGTAYSVMEIIAAFEKASGKKLPYKIVGRRAGDLPEFWANAHKANKELNWSTKLTVDDAMRDTINYLNNNKDK